jgi:hypothetical protein
MMTYTVVVYVVPDGSHCVEQVSALDPTAAAILLRENLKLAKEELEIVGIAVGPVEFALVDANQVALAPWLPSCPG